ncbi:MAG: Tad domain-containing protein [Bacillota bacterium]|nr:Tad domain-containing protein [Bacillota bacterium]
MKLFKQFRADEKGAVIVIVAMGMAAFLGFVALVTDVGLLYLTKQKLMNSADAAVLAGAQELPGDSAEARMEAEKYLAYNNVDHNYEINFSSDNMKIEARLTEDVNLFFAKALGWSETSTVAASSKAGVGAIVGYKGIVPFGILEQHVVLYQEYLLKTGDGSDTTGSFGALALGGGGASNFTEVTKYGYDQMVRVGDVLPIESGNMNGPVKKGLNWRMDQCTHGITCTAYKPAPGCPKVLIIPVYEAYEWESNKLKNIKVIGFAAFYVEKAPQNGEILGRFIRVVIPGEIGVGAISDYGAMGVKLIE